MKVALKRIKMKNKTKLVLAMLMWLSTTHSYATCSKSEVMKLVDKGFSKTEINSICGIAQKADKWITPTDTTCKANGGRIDSDGICKAKWENAKKICRGSGGSLPGIYTLREVVHDCGGTIVNFNDEDWEMVNQFNKSYQDCYKSKEFSPPLYYWSSTSSTHNSNNAFYITFGTGRQENRTKAANEAVRCVRDSQ